MTRYSPAQIWVLALGCLSTRCVTVGGGKANTIGPEEACVDFVASNQSGSAWTLADCIEVWTQFTSTIPGGLWRRLGYTDIWRETGAELRRAGSPCLAGSSGPSDGVGSTTLRLLFSWIFADEMGCDWVTPDWGRPHAGHGNDTVLYCHRAVHFDDLPSRTPSKIMETMHCSIVDWLAYFRFDVPSVNLPEAAKIKHIQVSSNSVDSIKSARLAIKENELTDQGWDRVLFQYDLSFVGRYFAAIGNWNEDRRQRVRRIIGQARQNFHLSPRPWYDGNPECAYDPARLNFAIHVRMGDRPIHGEEGLDYFHLLELFMDTVSEEVVRKGLEPPLFHLFSETLIPCPSQDTGLFHEFPTWPVHQVPECLTAEVPDDCPEKRAGRSCTPDRPGTFKVIGIPAVLHVGPSVRNALSCMIQADGLLMGCSSFGQIAGILSNGISFFSMHCSGYRTPQSYKTTPPIAVAERGHLWVPVAGSWHDPVLNSTAILNVALDTHLANKGKV